MKRIILFFAVCLGLSVSQTTFADDADAVRAASKRGTTTAVSSTMSAGRSVASGTKRPDNSQNTSKNARTAVKPQQRVISRSTTTQQNVKQREANTNKAAPIAQQKRISTASRTASSRTVNSRSTESSMSASARSAAPAKSAKRNARAAELNSEKITNIKSLNYSKCKTVYYECMDEFCANKDTNLRRCACSSRIHEFDDIKKQLADAEDKMLDFNQRLLTVSLDKEDAAAINVASEGELAFEKKDTTESEKLLQKITKTLNNSGDSKINNDLSSISLSLDMDTAWDSIDSMGGIATSAKSGLDLYNAARPICIEMAREVCNDDELDIAQDGYKLTIQQDCNTVAKSYDTLYNSAMEKIHESGALLDMSRLNIYQQRNSDDTLTCKKKILEQLSDTTVCGENLYKCLDTTGQYIDPSTGAAFLSTDLYNLTNLLQEPSVDEQWSKIDANEKFVNFLNSKKKFLEPAIEQCQDMSDMIWKEFLNDALAQIKLAQNNKLEEIRRSCTTLVAECKTDALQSLADFDARALSSFSVSADKTANAMCAEIQASCVSLMNTDRISTDWQEGITGIAAEESYNNLIETCTNVGRDCIVQQCNGSSGNFALCQQISDANRHKILTREACWDKVLECVKNADNLENMTVTDLYPTTSSDGYWSVGTSSNDICNNETDSVNKTACYIAKQIWGDCEYSPDKYVITTLDLIDDKYKKSNKVKIPDTGSSLLSWFATNNSTINRADSCNSKNGCAIDFEFDESTNTCIQIYNGNNTTDGCLPSITRQIINVTSNLTNYCASAVTDQFGNCCTEGAKSNGICVPNTNYKATRLNTFECQEVPSSDTSDSTNNTNNSADNTEADSAYVCPSGVDSDKLYLYCISKQNGGIKYSYDNNIYTCAEGATNDNTGTWVFVSVNGEYFPPTPATPNNTQSFTPFMYYYSDQDSRSEICAYQYTSSWGWVGYNNNSGSQWDENNGTSCNIGQPTIENNLFITYENISSISDTCSQ